MKRFIFACLLCLCALLSVGCNRSLSKDLLASYEELEQIMTLYASNPEKLMPALDAYIADNRAVWCRVVNSEGVADSDDIARDYSMYEKQITKVLSRIVNLDLAIQDNLRDDPEAFRAYMKRVANIGC